VRALGLAAGVLQERYTVWSCVETLRSCEDVNLGARLWMMAGASMRRLGAARDALYWSLDGRRGLALGPDRYALLTVRGSGLVARGRVADARLGAALRFYQRLTTRQSLALRLSGDGTRDLAPQDLPTLGAESGLRGFDAYRFWGERVVQANLEDRVLLVVNAFGLVSVGVVGFVDGGVAWQAGGRRAGRTRVSAGGGLRVQGTRTGGNLVTRIDLGCPIAGGEPGDGWVVSIGTGQAF
jgi:hemolysin activation/secretion protein